MSSYRKIKKVLGSRGDMFFLSERQVLKGYIDDRGPLLLQLWEGEKIVALYTVKGDFIVEWEIENA